MNYIGSKISNLDISNILGEAAGFSMDLSSLLLAPNPMDPVANEVPYDPNTDVYYISHMER